MPFYRAAGRKNGPGDVNQNDKMGERKDSMKQILRLPMQYFAEEKPEEPEEQKPKEQEKAADGKTFTQEDVNAIVAREVKKALKRAGQGQQARQQEAVVHLLPAGPPGRKCGVHGYQPRRPYSHPNRHTEAEPKLIRNMRRRNPQPGLAELWYRLKQSTIPAGPRACFESCAGSGCSRRRRKRLIRQSLISRCSPGRKEPGGCEGRPPPLHH